MTERPGRAGAFMTLSGALCNTVPLVEALSGYGVAFVFVEKKTACHRIRPAPYMNRGVAMPAQAA